MPDPAGIVLAAGAGRRAGGPKGLRRIAFGTPWIARAVDLLRAAGCDPVLVVLGAEADRARALVPEAAVAVVADGWAEGVGASLRAGLDALPPADAVLVTLVDLPDLPLSVPRRLLEQGTAPDVLARAVHTGRPGHPVLIGHDHWAALHDALHGDEGGRAYLEQHGVVHVECGDLFDGEDVDHR